MKKIITVIATCLILSIGAQAQTQKIGHINSLALLDVMPEMQKAKADIQAYLKTFEDQLVSMQKEYKDKIDAYQAGVKATPAMSDAIKEVKAKEIQDLEARIMQLNKSGEEKVQKKEEELTQPILKKADVAIKAVAKEKGYTYVIDASSGALLFAEDSDDLLEAVKIKLGMKP